MAQWRLIVLAPPASVGAVLHLYGYRSSRTTPGNFHLLFEGTAAERRVARDMVAGLRGAGLRWVWREAEPIRQPGESPHFPPRNGKARIGQEISG